MTTNKQPIQSSVEKITDQELQKLQQLQNDVATCTSMLGEITLQRLFLDEREANIKSEFGRLYNEQQDLQKILVAKYGEDSIISIETGIITKK